MDLRPYTFYASCYHVVDGDTMDVIIDVGFNFTTNQRLRLIGIDTPETWEEGGEEAAIFVEEKILYKDIILRTHKKDAFGRWLSSLYYEEEGHTVNLNKLLLEEGLADIYED